MSLQEHSERQGELNVIRLKFTKSFTEYETRFYQNHRKCWLPKNADKQKKVFRTDSENQVT